jgi:uncharacterized membrane protein
VAKAVSYSQRGDRAITIGFSKQVDPIDLPDKPWPQQPDRDATDIANAVQFSSAVFPEGKAKRLVLLSDGNDTSQHAAETIQRLAATGVEVHTVPLRNPVHPEVLVERVNIPATLKEREPFDLSAIVRSNVETKCTVRLYADGFTQGEQEITAKPGKNTVTFRNVQPGEGSATYQVEIVPAQDTKTENNKATATASVKGRPKVLIIDADPSKLSALQTALHTAKIDVAVRPVKGLPASLEDLQGFDALIISDVSALSMSREQMALYQQWVQDFGGGFAMLGGENSYGVGGYFRTPVEAMLPVRTEHDDRAEAPTVALLIILDSSGSMTAQVAGQTKISLADQGAALALDVLQPRDLFGVMAVDTKIHQIAPLSRHENKADVSQNILRVTAGGGGIYIYTSLVEAFAQLREVNAKIKHVILFSDAADAEEKSSGEMPDGTQGPGGNSIDLVNQMASARITTSVVGLGTAADKDAEFLKQLAQSGGGRYYLTSDALTLPQIFSTETMRVAQSSLSEEPVTPVPVKANAPVLDGIDWEQAPLLLGYNVTKLKPTADLLLATEKGDPLLATWRYGAGQVAAFTSDAKSRWAPEWINGWPGYGKFWAQLIRSILRRGNASGLQVQTAERNGRLEVQIDAVEPNGNFRNELPLVVRTTTQDGTPLESATARQIAPGRYRTELAVSGSGTSWVSVESPNNKDMTTSIGYTAPVAPEYLTDATNEEALRSWAQMTNGTYNPTPEQVFARPQTGTRRFTDLTNIFLSLALVLLPVDVWLRRRSWTR